MRIVKHIIRTLLVLVTVILGASCTKELREQEYDKQEKLIETFVSSQLKSNPNAKVVHNGGITRVTVSEGKGVEVNARGKAGIRYALYDFTQGRIAAANMVATNSKDVASSSKWELDEHEYELLTVSLSDKDIMQGLRDGLEGVREGEECYILFCGKYAFGKKKVGTIPANAPLAFHVWVEEVEN